MSLSIIWKWLWQNYFCSQVNPELWESQTILWAEVILSNGFWLITRTISQTCFDILQVLHLCSCSDKSTQNRRESKNEDFTRAADATWLGNAVNQLSPLARTEIMKMNYFIKFQIARCSKQPSYFGRIFIPMSPWNLPSWGFPFVAVCGRIEFIKVLGMRGERWNESALVVITLKFDHVKALKFTTSKIEEFVALWICSFCVKSITGPITYFLSQ